MSNANDYRTKAAEFAALASKATSLKNIGETIRIEEDLIDQLFNSSEKRLARVLLLLANFGKDGKPEPVIADISQETLAEMIGTTRSRVSFFMNKFRKLGFIDYNGRHGSPQLIVECRSARPAANQDLGLICRRVLSNFEQTMSAAPTHPSKIKIIISR